MCVEDGESEGVGVFNSSPVMAIFSLPVFKPPKAGIMKELIKCCLSNCMPVHSVGLSHSFVICIFCQPS